MTKRKEGPSLKQIRIATQMAGVEDVRVEDGKVKGRWAKNPPSCRFYGLPRTNLLEIFVNHQDTDDAIVRFTRQFGPLEYEHARVGFGFVLPQPGKEWSFDAQKWRSWQSFLRAHWEEMTQVTGPIGWQYQTLHGEAFAFVDGQYEFQVANLQRFLELILFCTPANKLRICLKHQEDEKKREEGMPVDGPCETPYFVVADLKQQYCSPKCAEWAQGQWKREWWEKIGKPRRQQKRRQQATSRQPAKRSPTRRKKRRR